MVRVPKKRVRFIHLHFNFLPCQTILFLRLVREPNSNVRSGFGSQNHFYPVRMRPVLFQNGGWRVSGKSFSSISLNGGDSRIQKTRTINC